MQFADLDLDKTYTYADYLKWTFDERLELIKGKIFKMSPAPSSNHQIIFGAVYVPLYSFWEGRQFMVRRAIRCAFDQKILSSGNNKTELKNKYQVYEELDVLEYWIIHSFEKTLYKYVLVNNRFVVSPPLTTGDNLTTDILPGFALNLDKVFAEVTDE